MCVCDLVAAHGDEDVDDDDVVELYGVATIKIYGIYLHTYEMDTGCRSHSKLYFVIVECTLIWRVVAYKLMRIFLLISRFIIITSESKLRIILCAPKIQNFPVK